MPTSVTFQFCNTATQTKLACLFLNSSCLFFFSSNSFFFSCCSCLIYSRMIHIRKVDSKTYFLPCGRNSLSSNLGTHLLANMDEFLERKKLRRASLSKVQNRKGSLKAVQKNFYGGGVGIPYRKYEIVLTSSSNLLDLLARWILLSKKFFAPPTPISPTSMLTSFASWLRPGMPSDENCSLNVQNVQSPPLQNI